MIIISAMTKDRAIGCADGLPWSIPDEYQQYLDFVNGQTIIFGRKTYDIFARDLSPETMAIVISRSRKSSCPNVAASLEDALALAKESGKTIYVGGGGTVYRQAIPLADEMYLSTVKGDFKGDTFFPEFNADDWEVYVEQDNPQFVFRKYRRISQPQT